MGDEWKSELPAISRSGAEVLDGTTLLDCTSDLREYIACVRPNQLDRADDDDENDCQHHGILSDVLSFFV